MKYQCYQDDDHVFDESEIQEYTHDGYPKCPFCGCYAEPVNDPEDSSNED